MVVLPFVARRETISSTRRRGAITPAMLAAVFDFSFPPDAPSEADLVNPDSPTSSAYVSRHPSAAASTPSITASPAASKPPRAACRVSFAPTSKDWDGLKVNSLVLDALVVRYFVRQQEYV